MRLFSNDPKKDEEEGSGRKVPKGFEKFLKKTKKGITHEENKEKKEDKKPKEQAQVDDDLSDDEEPTFSKKEQEKN